MYFKKYSYLTCVYFESLDNVAVIFHKNRCLTNIVDDLNAAHCRYTYMYAFKIAPDIYTNHLVSLTGSSARNNKYLEPAMLGCETLLFTNS